MSKKVKPFAFVNAKDLETPQQFVMHLLTAMHSLKTMESFADQAVKKGFLSNDELQKVEFIQYDLGRLGGTYSDLIGKLNERFQFEPTEIIAAYQAQTLQQAQEIVAGEKK